MRRSIAFNNACGGIELIVSFSNGFLEKNEHLHVNCPEEFLYSRSTIFNYKLHPC